MKYITLIIGLLVAVGCSKSLTQEEEKVVGTYEIKEDGETFREVYLENGVLESYRNGRKFDVEGKWEISKEGEIHIEWKDGDINVFRINKDGSITGTVAVIPINGKRTDIPKEDQLTLKKIK